MNFTLSDYATEARACRFNLFDTRVRRHLDDAPPALFMESSTHGLIRCTRTMQALEIFLRTVASGGTIVCETPAFDGMVELAKRHGHVIFLPRDPLDLQRWRAAAERANCVLLSHPHNPTGQVLAPSEMVALAAFPCPVFINYAHAETFGLDFNLPKELYAGGSFRKSSRANEGWLVVPTQDQAHFPSMRQEVPRLYLQECVQMELSRKAERVVESLSQTRLISSVKRGTFLALDFKNPTRAVTFVHRCQASDIAVAPFITEQNAYVRIAWAHPSEAELEAACQLLKGIVNT